MPDISIQSQNGAISDAQLLDSLKQALSGLNLQKILLLPPDMTRLHAYAGKITAFIYQLMKDKCQVDIMPALGTHDEMTPDERLAMFGPDIPGEAFIPHRWRSDVILLGQVPGDFVSQISDGLLTGPIPVELNRRLLDPAYDLILSIGQVVPHEVAGMANYTKNVLVGCGGSATINLTHFLGAVYGMEKVMGRDHSPVRKVFDYAERHFLQNIPLKYVLTVTTAKGDEVSLKGLFIGRDRSLFEQAVSLSRQHNLVFLDHAPRKIVVNLDEREFKSTWLGNKAIYRTRMAVADGGDLIILAPGVRKFGEDDTIDRLIRKYGYKGRETVLSAWRQNQDLQDNLSAAAHLIHGSAEGRFTITYACEYLTGDEIGKAGFSYLPYREAIRSYDPKLLQDGFNQLADGEEIYYISNPAIGLWASRHKFFEGELTT